MDNLTTDENHRLGIFARNNDRLNGTSLSLLPGEISSELPISRKIPTRTNPVRFFRLGLKVTLSGSVLPTYSQLFRVFMVGRKTGT